MSPPAQPSWSCQHRITTGVAHLKAALPAEPELHALLNFLAAVPTKRGVSTPGRNEGFDWMAAMADPATALNLWQDRADRLWVQCLLLICLWYNP